MLLPRTPRRAASPQVDTWPTIELNRPLYNLRDFDQPAGGFAGEGPFIELLERGEWREGGLAGPEPSAAADAQEGAAVPREGAPPYDGASRVLRWATQIVLSAGYDQRHPLSNKVEVTLRLRDLAREVGLSPAGVAHIAALCGRRCDSAGRALAARLRAR